MCALPVVELLVKKKGGGGYRSKDSMVRLLPKFKVFNELQKLGKNIFYRHTHSKATPDFPFN